MDDDSRVRERSASSPPESAAPKRATPAPAAHVSAGAARDRLEQKLRRGRAVLASLPAGDDRARLLHVAIMRRDESLLDGVLGALGITDSIPPRSSSGER